ncbi:MAG: hypothetical protein CO094_11500 [Anaerolineae bacterium CG_4_9_14_3_um_filter_57_17]|nr:hypothetical protein [bacterium]NCT21478.1 hypothetical protein [bacterium]OIO86657.1 MAG: hypothetical protein AUK01_02655 [Anaerolineae bacterium CG2_30_57_67]PJB64925.1 MAG: hypothetical protein CO094_11500 [Anaerolineae bacterium CG_4_9_14_3_um_filter_57_17]
MKINFRKMMYVLGALAILASSLGITPALAQTQPVAETPLFSALTWNPPVAQSNEIDLDGAKTTLAGTVTVATEPFNIDDDANGISAYYASPNLEKLGWKQVGITHYDDGVATLYFNEGGAFLSVEFRVCGETSSIVCLKVWQSGPTSLKPAIAPIVIDTNTPAPDTTGTLGKQTPVNGTSNLATSGIVISWSAYTGTSLNRYRYCYDTSNDNACDVSAGAAGWTSVWTGTSATMPTLSANKTYYWQVQAVLNDDTKVDADSGTYWAFSTLTFATFGKTSPANNATNQTPTVTLSWQSSPSATGGYRYCIYESTSSCAVWIYSATTSVNVSLLIGKTYIWQVRGYDSAQGTGNSIDADSGTWWTFSTASVTDFTKLSPANNVLNLSWVTTLSWQANASATGGYKYCISEDGIPCTTWVSTSNTSAQVILLPGKTYQWQVRAYNTGGGYNEANGGAFWRFSTAIVPGFTRIYLPFVRR